MKTTIALTVAALTLLVSVDSLAQSGHMMDGGMWGAGWMGGFGGVWAPILIIIVVVVGVVALVIKQKGK